MCPNGTVSGLDSRRVRRQEFSVSTTLGSGRNPAAPAKPPPLQRTTPDDTRLIDEYAPVEVQVFNNRAGATGHCGKRVIGDVDFEHGIFRQELIEAS